MDRVQLTQGYTATVRGSLNFTTKSPEIPGTYLIDVRRMTDQVDLRANRSF